MITILKKTREKKKTFEQDKNGGRRCGTHKTERGSKLSVPAFAAVDCK